MTKVSVEALNLGNAVFMSVDSPNILSREKIARMAFRVVGKKPKILRIPCTVFLASAAMVQPFHPRYGEILEFTARVFTSECIAPTRDHRRLSDYFTKGASITKQPKYLSVHKL